ncbi:hypothetical protein P280DRAFT_467280 [Massarina eburnea CBS 473.64]|uniref:Inner kinetochore subunit AME1 domain-containing protein n=1 Tax=Massarina eburnea CBS 473.64 TaxID=1395130 RepID=A0A6A6SAK2_9PLEO|nr:hypothetical protein P280DRAFT_467280 [Massarina eburnea CBS 473.64]
MAPVADRHERRQQRVRGAGPSSVQANFGFNLAALAPQKTGASIRRSSSVKRHATPKQRTATPRQRTATPKARTATPRQRTATPKARTATPRQRTATPKARTATPRQRTATPKARTATPRQPAATPQTGKRKRGSTHAQSGEDDGEVDDLSPDHDKEAYSVEKSRRVAGTVSPIREEDDAPDELSFLDDRAAAKEISAAARDQTPPITPGMLVHGRPRPSSEPQFAPASATPGVQQDGEDSEDELTPRFDGADPRVVATPQGDEGDELSSPAQTVVQTPQPQPASSQKLKKPQPPAPASIPTPLPAKRGRPKRVITDEEDEVQATPAVKQLRRKKTSPNVHEEADGDDAPDEISPEASRTKQRPLTKLHRTKPREKEREDEPVEVSSAEESDNYDPEEEEDVAKPASRPAQKQRPKPTKSRDNEPPRKRERSSGPKQTISVMRIKGSTVRGVTVADTTRTILEQNIDHQVTRLAGRLQTSQDSGRRKQIRSEINLVLAFKESLNEKLMDLQDANDTLSTGFQKRKTLRAGNIERRKEILAIQNNRQEVALKMDDEQATFDAEKSKADQKNILSNNLFDIEAAIQSGRELARRQDREDEGPDVPLSMLLEIVGRDTGSIGGGILGGVRTFNRRLESAAAWLESRA